MLYSKHRESRVVAQVFEPREYVHSINMTIHTMCRLHPTPEIFTIYET